MRWILWPDHLVTHDFVFIVEDFLLRRVVPLDRAFLGGLVGASISPHSGEVFYIFFSNRWTKVVGTPARRFIRRIHGIYVKRVIAKDGLQMC